MNPRAVLERLHSTRDFTQGALYVDGRFVCMTLEDGPRAVKVPGETRIPAGSYILDVRRGSPMATDYDNRFHDIGHDGMIWLTGVELFDWIYFHAGNRPSHTRGCILTGDGWLARGEIEGRTSTPAYIRAYQALRPLALAGERIVIREHRERKEAA